ncbi:MAG: tyrosine-type recombinase/integrase, partial [Acidimicrobiia bacterium]|nr:tyrosine-type recombinase/integrase [Acidimicrobiia bacterium]
MLGHHLSWLRVSGRGQGRSPARQRAGHDLAEITPHNLRHTCASLMRAAGADAKAIQQQLGHRNASVTLNTYTHL